MAQARLEYVHEQIGRLNRAILPLRTLLEIPQLVAEKPRAESSCSSVTTWQSAELVNQTLNVETSKRIILAALAEVLTSRCAEVEAALRSALQSRLDLHVHELSSLLAESASHALSLREVKRKESAK